MTIKFNRVNQNFHILFTYICINCFLFQKVFLFKTLLNFQKVLKEYIGVCVCTNEQEVQVKIGQST